MDPSKCLLTSGRSDCPLQAPACSTLQHKHKMKIQRKRNSTYLARHRNVRYTSLDPWHALEVVIPVLRQQLTTKKTPVQEQCCRLIVHMQQPMPPSKDTLLCEKNNRQKNKLTLPDTDTYYPYNTHRSRRRLSTYIHFLSTYVPLTLYLCTSSLFLLSLFLHNDNYLSYYSLLHTYDMYQS